MKAPAAVGRLMDDTLSTCSVLLRLRVGFDGTILIRLWEQHLWRHSIEIEHLHVSCYLWAKLADQSSTITMGGIHKARYARGMYGRTLVRYISMLSNLLQVM